MAKRRHDDLFVQWQENYRTSHGMAPDRETVAGYDRLLKQGAKNFAQLERQRLEVKKWEAMFRTLSADGRDHLKKRLGVIVKDLTAADRAGGAAPQVRKALIDTTLLTQEVGVTRIRGVRAPSIAPTVVEYVREIVQRWKIPKRTAARIVCEMCRKGGYEPITDDPHRGLRAIEDIVRRSAKHRKTPDKPLKVKKTLR